MPIKLPKYRIIERSGQYRVQRRWCGVWWTTFHTVGAGAYRMMTPYFSNLDAAIKNIYDLHKKYLEGKNRPRYIEFTISMNTPFEESAKEFTVPPECVPPPTGTSYQPPQYSRMRRPPEGVDSADPHYPPHCPDYGCLIPTSHCRHH